jgi:hypothetical protein
MDSQGKALRWALLALGEQCQLRAKPGRASVMGKVSSYPQRACMGTHTWGPGGAAQGFFCAPTQKNQCCVEEGEGER